MPLLAVESAVDNIAGIGQRRRKLPIEIRIVLDNKKAQRDYAPLALPDQGALSGIDGQSDHFAIAAENCQHVDEAIVTAAKPRPDQGAGRPFASPAQRGGKANGAAARDGGLALILVEADQRSRRAAVRRPTRLLRLAYRDSRRECRHDGQRKSDGQCKSAE